MIFAEYFRCLRELCNEGSIDLTEASQGLQSWHSFQICDITTSGSYILPGGHWFYLWMLVFNWKDRALINYISF